MADWVPVDERQDSRARIDANRKNNVTSIRRTNFRPAPRLVSGPNKNRPKNWIFEKLEDRHLMTGDPVVDPYAAVGATEEEIAEAAASAERGDDDSRFRLHGGIEIAAAG